MDRIRWQGCIIKTVRKYGIPDLFTALHDLEFYIVLMVDTLLMELALRRMDACGCVIAYGWVYVCRCVVGCLHIYISVVCVYVDNILCIGDRRAIDLIKEELSKYFSVKDKGQMEEYVGCSVLPNSIRDIILHQPYLIKKINREFGEELKYVRAVTTPAAAGDSVVKMTDDEKLRGGLPKERQQDIVQVSGCYYT